MELHRALPEKKYFKIGEVADLVGVEPHVLRYWETQFPQLRPHKARSGHRLYRRREVEALLVIRELLHVRRFTIAGARQALRQPGALGSLIPRFFQTPQGLPMQADTRRPEAAELSDEGDALAMQESQEGMVEIEAEGLDDDELADAMAREDAERTALQGVVRVEFQAEDPTEIPTEMPTEAPIGGQAAVRSSAPTLRPGGPVAHGRGVGRPAQLPIPLPIPRADSASGGAPGRQRALLEGALADGQALLALLDRMDRDAGRLRVHT